MKTTTGVKLDEATRARLRALSGLKDRSPHWLMKRAIAEYLDREERYEREKQEDLQRWQRYQESGVFIDHDIMRDRLSALAASARDRADAST
jgi:predicted transcriptional regulator